MQTNIPIENGIVISEYMNINLSATCACPKACDIVLYKPFMSYAASKQNDENRIGLPNDVLMTVGKHLNESLDTREYIEPEKRLVNTQEAERVIRFLPPGKTSYLTRYPKI